MMRNVERTKARLLEAATVEFSERGLAGARIDRIAEEAGVNKALIYSYFGNKEQLYDAVLEATISRYADEIQCDATDLPGYAVRRFEWQRKHPEISRLITWGQLERGGNAKSATLVAAAERKRAAIAEAQNAGRLSDRFSPEEILAIIDSLSMLGFPAGDPDDPATQAQTAQLRQTVLKTLQLVTNQDSAKPAPPVTS